MTKITLGDLTSKTNVRIARTSFERHMQGAIAQARTFSKKIPKLANQDVIFNPDFNLRGLFS